LQQFIIVEHAVEPVVDSDQQQQQLVVDQSALESMKHEAAVTADPAGQTEGAVTAGDMALADDMSMMDTAVAPPDTDMTYEHEEPSSADEPFVADTDIA